MLYLDPDRAKKIFRHVLTSGVVYFPIFIRYHWIAGILQPGGHSESLRLTIFDSAPSDNVHAELRRKLAAVWPTITIHIGRCARQRRYSEDCGIHMTANFFAHHLGVAIVGGSTVAARLRRYLYDTSLDPKPKATFLADVNKLLTQPQHTVSPVLGGVAPSGTTMTRSAPVRHTHRDSQQPGPKVQVSWTDIRPPQTPTGATHKTPSRLRHHTVGTETKARPDADTAPAQKQITPAAEPTVTKSEVPTMGNAVAPIQTSDIRKYANMRMAAAVHAFVDEEEADEKAVRATLPKPTRKVHFADPVVFSPRKTGHSSPQRPAFATKHLPTHRIEGGDDRPAQGDAAHPTIPPQAASSEETAFHSTVDYLWAATALANTGDGGTRALTARALVTQAGRLGFIRGIPYSLLEALKTLGKAPVPLPQPTATGEIVQQPSDEMYYYRSADTNAGLPTRFGGAVFRLGAYWDTPRDQDLSQQGGVLFGRYRLTTSETQAELGVYVSDARVQNADGPRRQRLPVATRHHPTAPAGDYNTEVYRHYRQTGNATVLPTTANGRRQAGPQNAVRVRAPVQEQLPVAVDTPPRQDDVPHHNLNDRGGLLPGGPACPRNWYIYPDKPPHISQLAWDAVTKGTRAVHRRWLYELRAMPVDLLGHRSLASAIIELIRRMAASRAWAWSTTSKAMASVSGALQQLPLYTNQNCPIILGHNVEWQKAAATAQRLEKERIAEPPAPITKDEKDAAQRNSLHFRDRQAALFLEMMWAFAARAGDLRTLQARDVRFTGGEPPPTVDNGVTVYPERYGVVLTMRRGKGARFRGPYSVPSTLPLEFAIILAHLLRERRPNQHLFAQPTETCNLVRTALRCENPLAALPSVRKGALRCMAANGMPIEQLMLMSGHRRADTLMRYLGYGHQLTTEAETAQANASDALY